VIDSGVWKWKKENAENTFQECHGINLENNLLNVVFCSLFSYMENAYTYIKETYT
jgi:hypothetical protein